MDDDRLFELARNNKKRGREHERETLLKGDSLALYAGAFLGVILILLKWIVDKSIEAGIGSIIFLIFGVQEIHEGIREGQKRKFLLGIVYLAAAIMAVIYFIAETFEA
jgi:hypothetical protein